MSEAFALPLPPGDEELRATARQYADADLEVSAKLRRPPLSKYTQCLWELRRGAMAKWAAEQRARLDDERRALGPLG